MRILNKLGGIMLLLCMSELEELLTLDKIQREAHKEALRYVRVRGSGTFTIMDSRPAKPQIDDMEITLIPLTLHFSNVSFMRIVCPS